MRPHTTQGGPSRSLAMLLARGARSRVLGRLAGSAAHQVESSRGGERFIALGSLDLTNENQCS